VIAKQDLGTGFRKIVVTDDQGATWSRSSEGELHGLGARLWFGGFAEGSGHPRQATGFEGGHRSEPEGSGAILSGRLLVLLVAYPPKSDFPGTGPNGNGISERIRDQGEWIELTKTDGCEGCHQLGDKSTREIPANLGAFDTSVAAWDRRIQSVKSVAR